MNWIDVETNEYGCTKPSRKLPEEKKWILLQIQSEEKGIPDKVCAGYLKYYAGDVNSPGFIIPGSGGKVKAFCVCLPDDFEYPKNTDND